MTTAGAERVELGRLGTLWPVGQDERGTVFTTASVRVGDGLPAVYKQYDEHFLTISTVRHVEALVRRLAGWGGTADRLARPTALVVSSGLITGYLMREPPGGLVRTAAVLAGEAPAPPADEVREELTELLALLHAHGVTLGERPAERLLLDPRDRPRCFLNGGDELLVHEPGGEPDVLQRIAMDADRTFVTEFLDRLGALPPPPATEEAEPEAAAPVEAAAAVPRAVQPIDMLPGRRTRGRSTPRASRRACPPAATRRSGWSASPGQRRCGCG